MSEPFRPDCFGNPGDRCGICPVNIACCEKARRKRKAGVGELKRSIKKNSYKHGFRKIAKDIDVMTCDGGKDVDIVQVKKVLELLGEAWRDLEAKALTPKEVHDLDYAESNIDNYGDVDSFMDVIKKQVYEKRWVRLSDVLRWLGDDKP